MAKENQEALHPERAITAIAAFFMIEGHELTSGALAQQLGTLAVQPHPDLGPLVSFRGDLGTLWVSARGRVVYYSGTALRQSEKPVTAGDCVTLARQFAERHVDEFKARNFVAAMPKIDTTSCKIRWTEQAQPGRETAIFPNWAEVAVQIPSGRVNRFSTSDLRLVRTTPPTLSEKQARERIRAQFSKAVIEEIELLEQPREGGKTSFTIWSAMVMTLAPEGPVTVRVTMNADTGEILQE